MKTKSYTFGNFRFRAYFRTVGEGWEVGLYLNRKRVFVGNFIHLTEARRWWGKMNREVLHFFRRYRATSETPKAWYAEFFGNHLYQSYYAYLDTLFTKYGRDYARAVTRDVKRFQRLKREAKAA